MLGLNNARRDSQIEIQGERIARKLGYKVSVNYYGKSDINLQ